MKSNIFWRAVRVTGVLIPAWATAVLAQTPLALRNLAE